MATTLWSCAPRKGTGFPGFAFVANEDSRCLSAVDLTRFAVARQIALDASPGAVIAHPSQPVVYVLLPATADVYEIDAARLSIKRRAHLRGAASGMRMAPDASALWVLLRDPRALVRISLDPFQPAGRIKLPHAPSDFDLSHNGRLAAVSFSDAGSAGIFDLAEARILALAAAGDRPGIIRFRSDGRHILIGSPVSRTVTVTDVETARVVVRLPVAIQPSQFCFTADGGQLFVTGAGMDVVVVIHPYQTEVDQTLLAGHAPGAMAISESPNFLFIANPRSGDVTVLEIRSRRVLAVVPVGQEPAYILITPDSQYALVLNRRSGDLAVIRIAAVAATTKTVPHTKFAPLFTMIPVGMKPVCAAVRAV